jgi:hypothetical protein
MPRSLFLGIAVVLFAAPAFAGEEPPPAPEAQVESVAPVAPVPPTVTMGKPRMVHGGAIPKGSDVALALVEPAIKSCYDAAIASGTDGEGSLELRLELIGPGTVASATVTSSAEVSLKLRGCVRDGFAGVAGGAVGPAPAEVLLSIGFDREVPSDFVRAGSACAITCDGELDDELKKEIRARAMRAGQCFKRSAAPGEPATIKGGALQVSLRIAQDGSVCGVGVGNDGFSRPSLTSCVVEAMSDTFVSGPGAGCVDVAVPIVFKGL